MYRFLIYPFVFATGFFPEKMLAPVPGPSLVYANAVFVATSLLVWSSQSWQLGLLNTTINWFVAYAVFYRRWRVALLLAWAATDIVNLAFGLHSLWIEAYVFFSLLVRDIHTRNGTRP